MLISCLIQKYAYIYKKLLVFVTVTRGAFRQQNIKIETLLHHKGHNLVVSLLGKSSAKITLQTSVLITRSQLYWMLLNTVCVSGCFCLVCNFACCLPLPVLIRGSRSLFNGRNNSISIPVGANICLYFTTNLITHTYTSPKTYFAT